MRTVTSCANTASVCWAIVCCALLVPASPPPGARMRARRVTVTLASDSFLTCVRAVTRADAALTSAVVIAVPHGATWTASIVSSQT